MPLHTLVVEVNNVKMELEAEYGHHGEKLFEVPLHIALVDVAQGE